MTETRHDRSRALLGEAAINRLRRASVLIAGLGGVGSYAVEALARSGAGRLILIDPDTVHPSNLNRQLYALESTLGCPKCEVAAARVRDIDPTVDVVQDRCFIRRGDTASLLERHGPIDFIIDAIDSVEGKTDLIATAIRRDLPLISCMGTARRLSPEALYVTDLNSTAGDPLARRMRQSLRRLGLDPAVVRVVFSREAAHPQAPGEPLGSVAFVPPVAGMMLAAEAVRVLTREGVD